MRSRTVSAPRRRRALAFGGAALFLTLALLAALWFRSSWTETAAPPVEPESETALTAESSAELFASDEEALAAATEAYAGYLAMNGEITSDAGSRGDRIAEYVTDEFLASSLEDFVWFEQSQIRSEGPTTYDTVSLQKYEQEGERGATVSMYVCLDVSQVRLVDAKGADVTPLSRESRLPLEVEVRFENPTISGPRVARSDLWLGETFCGD